MKKLIWIAENIIDKIVKNSKNLTKNKKEEIISKIREIITVLCKIDLSFKKVKKIQNFLIQVQKQQL